jgi:replicative DNA helicase
MSDIKTKAEQMLQRMALQLSEADSDEKAQQLYSELQSLYSENTDDFIVEPDSYSGLDKSYEELLENLYKPEKNLVYSTGIKSLDQLINGFSPGETVVIGSRPGMGRTTLALGFFKNFVLNQKIPSLFVSYEFSRTDIVKRLAAMQINIGTERMDKNKLNKDELINMEKAYNVFKETQGYVEGISFDLNKLKKLLYYVLTF